MRLKKQLILVILLQCLVFGCSTTLKKEEELLDAQYYFDRGMEMITKKDYVKAITNFQTVVESFADSPIVDHAQFMLAEAHFKSEEYLTAAFEYERVYKEYPSSKWAPEAQYRKAMCYYMESPNYRLDQTNTLLAISEFNRFIDTYPLNSLVSEAQKYIEDLRAKLAYKEYRAGEFYSKNKQYDAALFYFRYVINEYPRTIWADYSRFSIGEVHFKKKEFEQAKAMFFLVINAEGDAELKDKATKMLDKIESIESE